MTHATEVQDVAALERCSQNLTRSFACCAVLLVASVLSLAFFTWPLSPGHLVIAVGLGATTLAAYVWYAFAAGAAARAIGEDSRLYLAGTLAAPILAILLPWLGFRGWLPRAIAAAPLSIKFLLGNQLDEAQRRQTSLYLHRVD